MLSIIIISKNEEDCISRLLCSIKKQDFKDYEIILADAQSTDKTRKIAKEFGVKIIEGGLPSYGRNQGFKESKGDLLLFLNADVELPDGFLKRNIIEFKYKRLGCATTLYLPISYLKIDKFIFFSYNWLQRICQYVSPSITGFCIFVRRDVFIFLKGFDEKFKFMGEDTDFGKRATRFGKVRIIKSVPLFVDVRRFEEEGRINTIKHYFGGFQYYLHNANEDYLPKGYKLHGN